MPVLRSGSFEPVQGKPGNYVVREFAALVSPDLSDTALNIMAHMVVRQHQPDAVPMEWSLEESLPDLLTGQVTTALRVNAAVPSLD